MELPNNPGALIKILGETEGYRIARRLESEQLDPALREYLSTLSVTQAALSEIVGISQAEISNIITKGAVPRNMAEFLDRAGGLLCLSPVEHVVFAVELVKGFLQRTGPNTLAHAFLSPENLAARALRREVTPREYEEMRDELFTTGMIR